VHQTPKQSFRRATSSDAGTVRDIARSLSVNELLLYINAKFSTNLSFYAKRGFSEFLREPHVAGGEIVRMKKSIEG
jgi:hypothetical protein